MESRSVFLWLDCSSEYKALKLIYADNILPNLQFTLICFKAIGMFILQEKTNENSFKECNPALWFCIMIWGYSSGLLYCSNSQPVGHNHQQTHISNCLRNPKPQIYFCCCFIIVILPLSIVSVSRTTRNMCFMMVKNCCSIKDHFISLFCVLCNNFQKNLEDKRDDNPFQICSLIFIISILILPSIKKKE